MKSKLMDWFKISRVEIAHEDERRAISPIFNGDFTARQIKLLRVKQHSILGNHYHAYREMFCVLEGRATYLLENISTKQKQTMVLVKGDRLVIEPGVAHRAEMKKGTVTLEATEEPYISADKNDVRYEIQVRGG